MTRIILSHPSPFTCLDVDAMNLVAGSTDHSITLHHFLRKTLTYFPHSEWITRVILLNGCIISGAMDSKICIYNISRKSKKYLFHEGPITELKPMSDSKLFSSSYDGTVKLWCIKTGNIVQSFDQSDALDYTKAERIPIYSFAVSSENNILISANRHGALHEYDLYSSKLKTSANAHLGPIHHVFVRHSGVLSCGSKDGYLRGFDFRIPPSKGRRIMNIKVNVGGISNALHIFDEYVLCSGGGRGQIYLINVKTKSCTSWDAVPSSLMDTGNPKYIIYCIYMLGDSSEKNIKVLTSWGDGSIRLYHIIDYTDLILKKQWHDLKNAVQSFKQVDKVVYGVGDDGIAFALDISLLDFL